MKSLKLQLKVKSWFARRRLDGGRARRRLLVLLLILALELTLSGAQSYLSSGFAARGLNGRVFFPADGEFLFQTANSSPFQAFFGDRADGSRHQVRVERAGAALEMSLQGHALENLGFSQTLPEPTPNLPDYPDSTPSARLEKLQAEAESRLAQESEQISTEAGQLLGQIEAQVADITQDLGSISAGLESIQTQSAQIETEVESLIGQTFITVEDGQEALKTSGVLPGLDLTQQIISAGVRQNFIFKEPPQESSVTFNLNLEGLSASQDEEGNWEFLAESGRPLLSLTPPVLEDAAGENGAVTLEVAPSSPPSPLDSARGKQPNSQPTTHYSLLIRPDSSWLTSPDRLYPVTLRQDILAILLGLTTAKETFTALEELVFDFEYWPGDGPVPQESINASLTTTSGKRISVQPTIEKLAEGKYRLRFPPPRSLRAGKHTLRLEYEQAGQLKTAAQDFSWGVLAINVDKSIYLPQETAYLQMAVLDDGGKTVCDAALTLKILNPKSQILNLSTEDGTIDYSDECSGSSVTYTPDYFAYYQVGEPGVYQLELTAETAGRTHTITDSFEVRDSVPFDILRYGPTRIYPPEPYQMKLTVKANQDFEGEIKELVPASFAVTGQEGMAQSSEGSTKVLSWEVNLSSGQTREFTYEFDAPDQSPQFYLLGPLRLVDARSGQATFQEARRWQLAADSPAMPTVQDVTGQAEPLAVSSVTVNSVPGGTDQLYIAEVALYTNGGSPGTSEVQSVSGGTGLTWALLTGTVACSGRISQPRGEWWWAFGSPSTFGLTVTFNNATQDAGAHVAVSRISGAANEAPSNPIYGNLNGQSGACTGGTDSAAPAVTVTVSNTNSLILNQLYPRNHNISNITDDADYTRDYAVANISGGNASTIVSYHRTASPPVGSEVIAHTLASTRPWFMIAAEIKEAPSGPTNEQLLRHGDWFSSGVEQPYTF